MPEIILSLIPIPELSALYCVFLTLSTPLSLNQHWKFLNVLAPLYASLLYKANLSTTYLESLQTDLARLRFQLDRLLGTPSEVKAIMQLPGSVVRSLGLAGAAGEQGSTRTDPKAPMNSTSGGTTVPRTPGAGPLALAGSEGMSPAMLQQINSELLPLDSVTDSARRRGAESVALEGADYVAAPTRLGRLYVRRGRAAEAVTVLETAPKSPARTYWLARAYQSLERYEDAADLYRSLIADPDAADFQRQAERDLKFVDFSRELRNSGGTSR